MTESSGNTHAQPGWYADPAGSAQNRWWDGTQWTEHMQAPAFADYRASAAPEVASGTPVYNAFIWVIALLPVVSLVSFSLFNVSGYVIQARSLGGQHGLLGGWYVLVTVIGWVVYLVTVLLAYFDWQKLRRDGYVRPFHWAWTFLSAGVYVIGRSVIVRRRAGHGLIPIWVWAGITLIIMIVAIAKIFSAIAAMMILYSSVR